MRELILWAFREPGGLLGYLLRTRYREIEMKMSGCIIVSGAANRRNGRTSVQGDYLIDRLDEYRLDHPQLAKGTIVLFVSGNSFYGEGTTEAQALLRTAKARGLGSAFKALVCLDPPDATTRTAMGSYFQALDPDICPLLPLDQCSTNTYEGMRRAIDYCRATGMQAIATLANPLHNTWAWPLLKDAVAQSGLKPIVLCRLNSRQPWWDYRLSAPQFRLKAFPLFWFWGMLGKAKMTMNGWIKARNV